MDAVKFLKERIRMCHYYDHGCNGCPLQEKCTETESELMVNLVEQWSKSHPQKTLVQDFFEKYPNAQRIRNETPTICPKQLGYKGTFKCSDSITYCTECWSRPLED